MTDTIFALSSGSPPAAIGIIRMSGPAAGHVLATLTRRPLPKSRHAALRTLFDRDGGVLDRALVLWLPGPATATGEDCAEIHAHGGRAVIAALSDALGAFPGVRDAEAGEFTRRAFVNGRIDLAQAEALGDLLAAETELQRAVAQAGAGGRLSAMIGAWRDEVLQLSAQIEAALDFADEDDVGELPPGFEQQRRQLAASWEAVLSAPRSERLREGVRVVLAGPPNSGKSSLFNGLLNEKAAIVTPQAGTTRDVLERTIAWQGVPIVLLDTAGLREADADPIESIGIARAEAQIARADIVLWLGPEGDGPAGAIEIQPRSDDLLAPVKAQPAHRVSSVTLEGLDGLIADIVGRARTLLPRPSDVAINERQAALLQEALGSLSDPTPDLLLVAEALRGARSVFDRMLGYAGTEEMLDQLFRRFCIGK